MKDLLARHLFDADRPGTAGRKLHFILFEVLIVYQTLWLAWKWAPYIERLGTVVLPLGLANYVDVSFMFESPFGMLNAALMTVFALVGLLNRWRYAYLITFLLFHLHYIARFSQGEISHGSNFTGMAILALAVASIVFSDNGEHRRKAFFGMTVFFIGLGYTSASLCKLVATGFDWVDGRHLWLWIGERGIDMLSQHGEFALNQLQVMALEQWWIATAILIVGIVTEFIGFTLWFRPTRWFAATMLIVMHVGIAVSMNITFSYFFYVLAAIGYPWGHVFDKMLRLRPIDRLSRRLRHAWNSQRQKRIH